jgi:outer membrane lipoprotein carrier protein
MRLVGLSFVLSLCAANIAVAAPAAPTPAPAPAPTAQSADQVLDNVQRFYANIKAVTATFRQTVTNETFGTSKTSDGKAWIEKPGKMRWDYYEDNGSKTRAPVKKSFISDGKTLWVVEFDNKQVGKKDLTKDMMPVVVSFLYGKGDLKAEFNAELDKSGKYGAAGDYVLKLTPKQPSAQYKNLYLAVAPDNFRVRQSTIIDSSNNMNKFDFYQPDFESKPSDAMFKFDESAAKNYKIIDGDAPAAPADNKAVPAPAPAPK